MPTYRTSDAGELVVERPVSRTNCADCGGRLDASGDCERKCELFRTDHMDEDEEE